MLLQRRFDNLVDRLATQARLPLRLQLWNGRRVDLSPSPTVTISLPRPSALRYLVNPDLEKLGEAFVEGDIQVEGPIHEVFRIGESLARQATGDGGRRRARGRQHTRTRDRRAIEYHYDVSNDFYALFLDRSMVYSCAYYRSEAASLEQAQEAKLDHILRKLALRPGDRLLDIGCGWGALVMRAAQHHGVQATGVTLSSRQLEYARERIRAAGLGDRCRVELLDYRDLEGEYDGITSVGMFEHVGLQHLPEYFAKIRSLLTADGRVLNHGITSSDTEARWMPLGAGEFIDRYVFPEGELTHVSQVLHDMSGAGLEVVDVESLRRHYARTCREWADRLEAARERAEAIAGGRRARIWQIYLAGCAYGFAEGWINLYQVLACRADNTRGQRVPMTRDYMYGDGAGKV
ncbi:MAG: cyclopropane-fatty-acyl-phospholipid synthase family protein [Burkholderiales bacterium]|nr:cyclopropane-fatty-acyl-phospholipid synthase family protein [Burkholderiales bacterium]